MKILSSLFILTASLACHNSMFCAAAAKQTGSPRASGAEQPLIDVTTKFGKYLNAQLLQMPNEKRPSANVQALLNASLAKGKAMHQAHATLIAAIEAQDPAERRILNAGKLCLTSSTVNARKAATAEYQKQKQENCERIDTEFPQAHPKLQALAEGTAFIKAKDELIATQKELSEAASKEVLEIIGARIAEIDTLGNLVTHCGPADAE